MFFKIAKSIIFGLLVVLAIFSLFPFLPPFKGFYKIRAVMSGSMEKAIPQGSLIINQWTEDKNLKIGDIITYRRPDLKDFFITHRIKNIEKEGFFYFFKTQGDQVSEPDKWRLNQSQIEGKVIFTIPLLGYLYVFVQSPLGFLFFIIFPGAWLIFGEIKNIKKELEKQRNSRIPVFLLVLAFFFLRILPTYAYFSSGAVSLTGTNLSIVSQWGDNPPSSSLAILADYQKLANFNLAFSVSDDLSQTQEVKLYYARDSHGAWAYFGHQTVNGNPASGSFSFNSPKGDGFYRFLTIAIDETGKIEDDADGNGILETEELDLLPADTWTVVDTAAPVTSFSVSQPLAVVNEQIYNGGFENGNLDGWVTSGAGSHQATQAAVKIGGWSALLGNASLDSLSKAVSLSSDVVSAFSFWYRLLTNDNVSGGFFEAIVKNGDGETKIVHDGWDDPTVTATDLGWKNVAYQLNNLVGQNIDLQFKVSQPSDEYKTWVYLDDIRVTAATNSATASSQINLFSHDASGSGVAKIFYQIDDEAIATYSAPLTLDSGIHSLTYFAKDEAGNNEATKSMTINATKSASVDFGVVLNEFLPNPTGDDYTPAPNGEWVELYNNSPTNIDLNGWKLKDNLSHELIINASKTEGAGTIIASGGKLKIYRRGSGETSGSSFLMNNDNDTVNLLKPDNALADSFTYNFSAEGKSFKRYPDGTGTWKDPETEIVTDSTYEILKQVQNDEKTMASEFGETTITASLSASIQPLSVIIPEPTAISSASSELTIEPTASPTPEATPQEAQN